MADWIVEWESGKSEQVSVHTKEDGSHMVYREGNKQKAERWPENWPDAIVSAVEVKSDAQPRLEMSKPGRVEYIYNDQGSQNLRMLAGLGADQQHQARTNNWYRQGSANYYMP